MGFKTHNHLVREWALNHFAKLTKWMEQITLFLTVLVLEETTVFIFSKYLKEANLAKWLSVLLRTRWFKWL